MQDINCAELKKWLDDKLAITLLDVREDWEVEICMISGARHISLSELPDRVEELSSDMPLAIICHHGVRSRHAGMFLEERGFKEVFNVRGGIDVWAVEIQPEMNRYD